MQVLGGEGLRKEAKHGNKMSHRKPGVLERKAQTWKWMFDDIKI